MPNSHDKPFDWSSFRANLLFKFLGHLQGRSLGNQSTESDKQSNEAEDLRELFRGWFIPLLDKSKKETEIELIPSTENEEKNRIAEQINLRYELSLKSVDEELKKVLEEQKELRQKADTEISKVQGNINAKADESESANQDAIKYRLLGSLIFFGVLDVFDIIGNILDNFVDTEKYEEAVRAIIADEKVLGFLGKVNDALEIDQVAKALAQFPIFHELNQFLMDLAKSDIGETFTGVANEALFTDDGHGTLVAKFALNSAILLGRIKAEAELMVNDNNNLKEGRNEVDKLGSRINEMLEKGIRKYVISSIEVETTEALRNIDFKVLQDYRNGSIEIPVGLKADLKNCRLFDINKKEISADDLLYKNKFNDEAFSAILKRQPNHKINELTGIAEKNHATFDGLAKKNYTESRSELLSKLIENIDIPSIASTLDNMGGNPLITSGAVDECKNKEGVVAEIMKLDRKDADNVIFVLAKHINNVNFRIAGIKAGDKSNKKEMLVDSAVTSPSSAPHLLTENPGRPVATELESGRNFGDDSRVIAELGHASLQAISAR